MNNNLQHHGVKGMKWGVRRYQPYPKGSGHKGKFLGKVTRRVRESASSRKREASALVTKLKLDSMSTKDIQKQSKRLQQENDMKRLARTSKEKSDYRNRGNMSDQEVLRKANRLRIKEQFRQNADKAGEDLIKAGKRIASSVISLGITFKSKSGEITMGDIYDSVMTPNHAITKNVAEAFMDILNHNTDESNNLQHHGVKGMKWGVRRYQPYPKGSGHKGKFLGKAIQRGKEKRQAKKTFRKEYWDATLNLKGDQRKAQKKESLHKMNMVVDKAYKKGYDKGISSGLSHDKAVSKAHLYRTGAEFVENVSKTVIGLGAYATAVGITKAANSPAVMNRGKNIIQAIKKSPIRYVDGSTMTNIIRDSGALEKFL